MNTTILPDGSAFSVATVMSKEEAMKLPLKDRPICFRLSSKMYHKVWESIGEASMTFNKDAGNEIFNTEQASKIAMSLLFAIADEVESRTVEAHTHVNNGIDDACKQCGKDLRDQIHKRSNPHNPTARKLGGE
jgi:hypothetical protein